MRSAGKNLVYGALDLLTARRGIARRIGGETVRFPPRVSRYYEADYEPETFVFLRETCRDGDVVLDIGAHIGLFSVVMARLVGPDGRVLAFEPTPTTRRVLEDTIRLNGLEDRVEIRGEAVSSKTGRAVFFDTGDLVSNANSLVPMPRHGGEILLDTVSVDEIVDARGLSVGCIKIDVEGAELDALKGAVRCLRSQRPALALALHPDAIRSAGASLDAIWELLDTLDLAVHHRQRLVNRSWFCRQDNLFDVQCRPLP